MLCSAFILWRRTDDIISVLEEKHGNTPAFLFYFLPSQHANVSLVPHLLKNLSLFQILQTDGLQTTNKMSIQLKNHPLENLTAPTPAILGGEIFEEVEQRWTSGGPAVEQQRWSSSGGAGGNILLPRLC